MANTVNRRNLSGSHSAASHQPRHTAGTSYQPSHGRKSGQPASRAEGAQAYSARRKRRKGRTVLRALLAVLLVIVAGAGTALALYIRDIDERLGSDVTDDLRAVLTDEVKLDDPFYMLLLGVDKNEGRAADWGDDYSNFRSDTIILARVDPKGQKVALVSIPRDTMVTIPGYGEDKINAAYSLGGPSKMVEVVEDFAGVDISHYAEVDFEQFTSIVDTIGGIEVTLPVPVVDLEYANINLPAGTQVIDGTQALGLARSRHAYDEYGGGDFFRAANQRMIIGAVIKKVLALDPLSMVNTVSELANSVTTDFKVGDIVNLATQFRSLDVDNDIYSGQTPTISELIDEIWYELPNEVEWAAMMDRVKAGLPPYENADQDFTAGVAGSLGNAKTGEDVKGSTSTATPDSATSETTTSTAEPSFTGYVLVVNGAGVTGLATEKSETLDLAGFIATPYTADELQTKTEILYTPAFDGAESAAVGVAQSLGLPASAVKANDGSYWTTDYDVVVVLGTDAA